MRTQVCGGAVVAKDPVCGMSVEQTPNAPQSTHEGSTYYFRSPGCKEKFDVIGHLPMERNRS